MAGMSRKMERAFLDDIRDGPLDPAPKLAFADWLRDEGRADLAFAMHWCASAGRHPASFVGGSVAWHRRHSNGLGSLPSIIHEAIFSCLPKARRLWRADYRTLRAAFISLSVALRRLLDLLQMEPV